MELDILALQKQLQDKIAAIDKQAKEQQAKFASEEAKRQEDAEVERSLRIEEHRKKLEAIEVRRKKDAEEYELRKREELKARQELEIEKNKAAEINAQRERMLEDLKEQIAKAEFIEEANRKALEDAKLVAATRAAAEDTEEAGINVEHPEAPLNAKDPGAGVEGTAGHTPDNPLMSQHLKHILRQAERNY